MQHSVEQQKQLVEVTRQQLASQNKALEFEEAERDRSSQPKLELTRSWDGPGSITGKRSYSFQLTNFGHAATDVRVFDAKSNLLVQRAITFETGSDISFRLELPTKGAEAREFRVVYVDGRGFNRVQSYVVSIDEGTTDIRDATKDPRKDPFPHAKGAIEPSGEA